jgi:hypothetical protein
MRLLRAPQILTVEVGDLAMAFGHSSMLYSLSVSRRFRVRCSRDNHDGPLHGDVFENMHTGCCRCQFDGILLVVDCHDMLHLHRDQATARDIEGDPGHRLPRSIMDRM